MTGTDTTQVLRFTLGEDDYCLPIDYVAEIVDDESIQSLPNVEAHVEGVTDLRGRTTTVVDPSRLLNVDTEALLTDGGRTKSRIVVLDSDALGEESPTGWLVSAVNDVRTVAAEAVDTDSVGDTELLHGLLKDDDGYTLWLDPHEFTA